MALGTVPPIAAMMLLAMEGCRGTIMKSCFGRKVFRLRVAVGSSEAPGMRVSVSCCRSPSNETCASPASSSIKASSRRLLSCTFQNLKGPSTREFYHHEPTQLPTPQLRYVLVNGITSEVDFGTQGTFLTNHKSFDACRKESCCSKPNLSFIVSAFHGRFDSVFAEQQRRYC